MDVKNTADLTKIIDLCRKKGVESIEIDGIKLTLRPDAPLSNYKKKQPADLGSDRIEVDQVYDEDATLFWSSAGLPTEKEAI